MLSLKESTKLFLPIVTPFPIPNPASPHNYFNPILPAMKILSKDITKESQKQSIGRISVVFFYDKMLVLVRQKPQYRNGQKLGIGNSQKKKY